MQPLNTGLGLGLGLGLGYSLLVQVPRETQQGGFTTAFLCSISHLQQNAVTAPLYLVGEQVHNLLEATFLFLHSPRQGNQGQHPDREVPAKGGPWMDGGGMSSPSTQ